MLCFKLAWRFVTARKRPMFLSLAGIVFGVSFFEVLQYGIPTVVFSPYDKKDDIELENLKKLNLAMVAKNEYEAVEMLVKLMKDHKLATKLSKNAKKKMENKGSARLVSEVKKLLG